MATTLTDVLAKIKNKELPRSNLTVNAAIEDYLASSQKRKREKAEGSLAATNARETKFQNYLSDYAGVLGLPTPEEQQSEAIGKLYGATNPSIREAKPTGFNINLPIGGQPGSVSRVPKFENISTQPQQEEPTLADFIRNPTLGVQAQAGIEDERKRTNEIIKSNLIAERQIKVAQFKEGFKGKSPKSPMDMSPNEIFRMATAYADITGQSLTGETPSPQMIQEAHKFFFAGDVPVKDTLKGAGLSEEAQEVLKKRKK